VAEKDMEMSFKQFAAPRISNDAVCIWLYAGKPGYPALLSTSDAMSRVTT